MLSMSDIFKIIQGVGFVVDAKLQQAFSRLETSAVKSIQRGVCPGFFNENTPTTIRDIPIGEVNASKSLLFINYRINAKDVKGSVVLENTKIKLTPEAVTYTDPDNGRTRTSGYSVSKFEWQLIEFK